MWREAMNMTRKKVVILLVAGISVIGCVLGLLLLRGDRPVDQGAERIAFTAQASPRFLGLLTTDYSLYVMNVDSPGLARVTRQGGYWLALSPTGDRIVYSRDDRLYIANTDGSGQPELVWDDTALTPAWSPDGSRIAFADYTSVNVLDLETGQVTQLTDESIRCWKPAWSPDGSRIALTRRPRYGRNRPPDDVGGIAVINADGSGFTQLTFYDSDSSPEWSPDGNRIAFVRDRDIYVMNADGTNVAALTHGALSTAPTWSPDGNRIAFVSYANSECGRRFADFPAFCTSEIHVMNADGSDVTVIRSERYEWVIDVAWCPQN
jgi:Tol biopolymer transport system component